MYKNFLKKFYFKKISSFIQIEICTQIENAFYKVCARILLAFFSFNVYSVVHAKVPDSWIQGNSARSFAAAEADPSQEVSMIGDLDQLMDSNYAVVSPSLEQKDKFFLASSNPKINKGPWYLASVKTEVGVSAEGEIGYVGVNGSACVEYIWMRTAHSTKKLQQEHYGNKLAGHELTVHKNLQDQASRDTLALSTEMENSEIAGQVQGLVSYVQQTGKVSHIDRMKSQLMQHVLYHQMLAKKLSQSSQNLTWTPYKYQLELFVTASGDVLPGIELGGVLRFRIEWTIKQTHSLVATPSAFSEHVEQLTSALSRAHFENFNSQNAYDLYAVKLGLGIGIGGNLDIVQANAHAISSVFLKYNPPQAFLSSEKASKSSTVQDVLGAIEYSKWDGAIQKIVKMTNLITNQASRYENKMDQSRPLRDFELGAIEIELQLSAGGEFFLPTVEGIAFMEVFYNKKNRLKP